MGRGANLFFNAISIFFLILTVIVAIVVLAVASDTMEAPLLAPQDTLPPPTIANPPTLTPSPVPSPLFTVTPSDTGS